MTKVQQTKTARVQTMLKRPRGASLEAICKMTGWQPHSARAALSGLRKAGHQIERAPAEGSTGGSIHRFTRAAEASK